MNKMTEYEIFALELLLLFTKPFIVAGSIVFHIFVHISFQWHIQ